MSAPDPTMMSATAEEMNITHFSGVRAEIVTNDVNHCYFDNKTKEYYVYIDNAKITLKSKTIKDLHAEIQEILVSRGLLRATNGFY